MADTNRSQYLLTTNNAPTNNDLKNIILDIQAITTSSGGGDILADGSVNFTGIETFEAGIKTDLISASTDDLIRVQSAVDANLYADFDVSITDQNVITIPDNSGTMLVGALQAGTFTPDATKAIRIKLVDGNEYLLQVVT